MYTFFMRWSCWLELPFILDERIALFVCTIDLGFVINNILGRKGWEKRAIRRKIVSSAMCILVGKRKSLARHNGYTVYWHGIGPQWVASKGL